MSLGASGYWQYSLISLAHRSRAHLPVSIGACAVHVQQQHAALWHCFAERSVKTIMVCPWASASSRRRSDTRTGCMEGRDFRVCAVSLASAVATSQATATREQLALDVPDNSRPQFATRASNLHGEDLTAAPRERQRRWRRKLAVATTPSGAMACWHLYASCPSLRECWL